MSSIATNSHPRFGRSCNSASTRSVLFSTDRMCHLTTLTLQSFCKQHHCCVFLHSQCSLSQSSHYPPSDRSTYPPAHMRSINLSAPIDHFIHPPRHPLPHQPSNHASINASIHAFLHPCIHLDFRRCVRTSAQGRKHVM